MRIMNSCCFFNIILPVIFQYIHASPQKNEIYHGQENHLYKPHGYCNGCSEIYCKMNQESKEFGVLLREVFLSKDYHCIIKNKDIIHTAFLGAFAFVMDDCCFGEVIVFISCFDDSIG